MAKKYTPHGLRIYGEMTDDDGNIISIEESSAIGGIWIWLFIKNQRGEVAATPYLTRAQARKLATILLRFAEEKRK